MTVVMGPNGAGKTTLVKTILGMVKRDSGDLRVFGLDPEREPDAVRSLVSYMPQISSVNRSVPLRVIDVVSSPYILGGASDPVLVERALEITGLSEYRDRFFYELSGGLMQRALVARAIAKRARMLVLDEPLSMTDVSAREQIIELLVEVMKRESMSILVVAHDIAPCLRYDPYVLLLNKRLVAFGKAHEVLRPDVLGRVYGLATVDGRLFFLGEEHGHGGR